MYYSRKKYFNRNKYTHNNQIKPNSIKQITKHLEIKYLHNKNVTCITTLSMNRIATGSDDESISICIVNYSSKTYTILIRQKKAHNGYISYLSEIPGKNVLISCSSDKTIKLWDTSKQTQLKLRRTLKGHSDWIEQAIYIENNIIASYSLDNTVRLWNYKYNQQETSFKLNDNPYALFYLQQKQIIMVSYKGRENGYINVYDSRSPHNLIKIIEGIFTIWKNGIITLNDRTVAVIQSYPPSICIIDTIYFKVIYKITNNYFICERGSLCSLNDNSFLYVWNGKCCQIVTSERNKY